MSSAMAGTPVKLGTVVKTVGLKGEVKLNPAPDFWPAALEAAEFSLVSEGGVKEVVSIESVRAKGNAYILKLNDCETVEDVESFVGCDLEIDMDGLDESVKPDTVLPFQVVGLEVRLPDGMVLGRVVDLLLGRAQNCIIVEDDEERFLIPDVPGIVKKTDLKAGFIEVDPPEGLLDLRW
jgi:16S rRNA processing protein RimM